MSVNLNSGMTSVSNNNCFLPAILDLCNLVCSNSRTQNNSKLSNVCFELIFGNVLLSSRALSCNSDEKRSFVYDSTVPQELLLRA